MRKWYLLLLIIVSLLFTGCELEDEEGEEGAAATTAVEQGWHFPGRDCLACHNADLQAERQLSFGGTIYKSSTVTDVDDLSQVCGGDFVVKFLDTSYATQITSADNQDVGSKGYKGEGNLFMLARLNNPLNNNYIVQIVGRESGVTVAQSTNVHQFNGNAYNIYESANSSNAIACNACHKTGGLQAPLYANITPSECK